MGLTILVLSLLFFCVLILGFMNRSRESFFLKYYGLENHKYKYFIQNIINYILCTMVLIITCMLYFFHVNGIIIVLIPFVIKIAAVLLKKIFQ